MVLVACPWCEHEIALTPVPGDHASLRCDACASEVDLAPLATPAREVPLALAA